MNELIEKGKYFVSNNKAKLIKGGAIVVGAIIGAIVVGVVISAATEADSDFFDASDPDWETEVANEHQVEIPEATHNETV